MAISLCVRCVSYSFVKSHNEAVILLVCKNLCKNLSLLLSNLLGGLVFRWQKSNMVAVGCSEWSLCQAWCKHRSVIPDSDWSHVVLDTCESCEAHAGGLIDHIHVPAIFQTSRHECDTCCNIFMNELFLKYNFVTAQQLYNLSDSILVNTNCAWIGCTLKECQDDKLMWNNHFSDHNPVDHLVCSVAMPLFKVITTGLKLMVLPLCGLFFTAVSQPSSNFVFYQA